MTNRHKISARLAIAVLFASAALALSGCSPSPVIEPVTVSADDLQGETVTLKVNQVLNIDTGDLDVDSYQAEISNPSIARFDQGKDDGDAVFNPGITALAAGTTEVVLTNDNGGIQALTFTVEVTG